MVIILIDITLILTGICHCFDCRAECFVLEKYIASRGLVLPRDKLDELIAMYSERISDALGSKLSTYVHLVRAGGKNDDD